MRRLLIVLAVAAAVVAAALVAGLVAWALWRTHSGGQRAYAGLAARIEPVEAALTAGKQPAPADLERFARNRETRKVLHDALERHGRLDLFPIAYRTPEAMAEADLVLWLTHPNELDAPPAEIELMAKVPAPEPDLDGHHYFVFRYRTHPPHWAAEDGWMAGIAGPFTADGSESQSVSGTFSRFEPYESRTPEEHVRVTRSSEGS